MKEDVRQQVANIILRNRKVPAGQVCDQWRNCPECCEPLIQKFEWFAAQGLPILMFIMCYPFKMPNPRKCMCEHPDEAERRSLLHLHQVCKEIGEVYEPGANIVLCLDGRALVPFWSTWWSALTDETVTRYVCDLKAMIVENGFDTLTTWGLDDVVPGTDHDTQRNWLMQNYAGVTIEQWWEKVGSDPVQLHQYRGQKTYFTMDGLDYRLLNGATGKHLSKESVKKVAGDMAKKAMFYSDALRNLASETFPNGIRLSCHEYPPHQSSKIGFHLVEAHDAWLTPWHGVMVYVVSEDRWILMKNYQAQAIGSRLVEVNGKANHYEIDHWKAPPDWPNE